MYTYQLLEVHVFPCFQQCYIRNQFSSDWCVSWFSPYPISVTLCSIAPHLVVDEKQSDKLILTKV